MKIHKLSFLHQVGKNVNKVKVGDKVGVGTIVESCSKCEACLNRDENYCHMGHIGTYNHQINYGSVKTDTGYTLGGYSTSYTVPENFALKVRYCIYILSQNIKIF